LLALLAGMSPAAPSSSVGACASSSGQASGAPQDGPADTEPFPGSLEATVAALVHQTSGLGPGFTTPAHPALALPPVVDPTTAQAQPGVAVAAGPSDSRSLDNADPSAPMVATGTGSPVAVPAPTNRSEERSPVSVLARGDGGNGSGSPVSVLAHSRDADRPGTAGSAAAPIAAVDADPSAALPPNDAAAPAASTQTAAGPSRRPSGTLGELQAPAPPAVGPPAARPAHAVAAPAATAPAATPEAVAAPRAPVHPAPPPALPPTDAAAPAAPTQPAAGPSRRPSGTLGELQAPAPPAVGPPAARPAEAVAAPADTAPAATPEAVADQI